MQAQISKTVVCTAGGLTSALTVNEKSTITNLTITGTIDARDFVTMRDSLPGLNTLDLSYVNIISYTGTLGTAGSTSITYAVNTIPQYAFYNQKTYTAKKSLTYILFPASITTIGNYAFSRCTGFTNFTIPSSVVTIERNAFEFCDITSINLPSSISSIGFSAFSGCYYLSSVTIPSSLSDISSQAFSGCASLTYLAIPSTIKTIGSNVFDGCTGLKGIYSYSTTPVSLTTSTAVFNNISTVKCTLYVAIGSKSLYSSANQWKAFPIVELSTNKTVNCTEGKLSTSLTEAMQAFTEKLTITGTIDARDFKTMRDNMPSLKEIDISAASIVAYSGTAGPAGTTSFSYPSNTIPQSAFYISASNIGKTSLTSFIMPSSITSIDESAFQNCSNIITLPLSTSMINIGNSAFSGCSSLKIFSIPSSVTSIGSSAFSGFTSLTKLYSNTIIPVDLTSSNDVFTCININLCELFIPFGSEASYLAANQWNVFQIEEMSDPSITAINCTAGALSTLLSSSEQASITNLVLIGTIDARDFKTMRDNMPLLSILDLSGVSVAAYTGTAGPAGTTSIVYQSNTIPKNTFFYKKTLTSIKFPLNLTTIGETSIYGCSGIKSIKIPYSVSLIDFGAFGGCTGLTTLNIPFSVKTIGKSAFVQDSGLTSVSIPTSITSLGDYVFSSCTGLTSISIPKSVKSFGSHSFANCTGLKTVDIPTSITSISEFAFEGCTGLESISIPSSVTSISTYAFNGCNGVKTINIPSSVITIGVSAFQRCSGDFIVDLNNNNFSSVDGVLFNKNKTTLIQCTISKTGTYSILPSVIFIGTFAFIDCMNLSTINIPNSVKYIESFAFRNCTGLTTLNIPTSVTSIGMFAFHMCTSLKTVTLPTSITAIELGVFQDCTSLTSVNIPSSVLRIDVGSFENCTSLTSIIIPSSVTYIGTETFSGCTNLKSIFEYSKTPVYLNTSTDVFLNVNKSICTLYVMPGLKTAYSQADQWKAFTIVELLPTKTVNCSSGNLSSLIKAGEIPFLKKLIITGTIDARDFKTIRDSITTLTEIDLSGATIVSYSGTDGTAGTKSIDYLANTIPKNAFYNSSTLTSIIIPSTTITIDSSAFNSCIGLVSLNIPISVTSLGANTFADCSGLTSLYAQANTPIDLSSSNNVFSGINTSSCMLYVPFGKSLLYSSANQWSAFSIIEMPDPTIKYVNCTAGSLSTLLTSNELAITTKLIVTGTIDARDFKTMRDNMPVLKTIDISGATIAAYSGYDGTYSDSPFYSYSYINYSANAIPQSSFYNLSNNVGKTSLMLLIMPSTITAIKGYAFNSCTNLSSISIPSSVINIDSSAFAGCTSLTAVSIPSSVTSIGQFAFYNCTSLTSFTFPTSITSLENGILYNCKNISSLTIPNTITKIGSYALAGCSGLTSLNVQSYTPVDLTTSYDVFSGINTSICKLIVPVGSAIAYSIANQWDAFISHDLALNCIAGTLSTALNSDELKITNKLTLTGNIDARDFKTMRDKMPNLSIIDLSSVNVIAYTGTEGTEDSTVINYESNTIPQYAFSLKSNPKIGKKSLTSLIIPLSVSSIGKYAFNNCESLTSILIPSNITTIDDGAFSGCNNFKSITIPSSVKTIADYLFSSCQNLTSITIPSSVTNIGSSAFENCLYLSKIDIPSSVTVINKQAFHNCQSLKSITIPTSVTYIGSSTFSDCRQLISILLPLSINAIENNLFNGCISLTSVIIPSSITSIGDSAFLFCSTLASINIPSSVKTIGNFAFGGCIKINSITLPTSINSIKQAAFWECKGLNTIFIPSSIMSIENMAFQNCKSLTSISIPSSVTSIGYYAFNECTGLNNIYSYSIQPVDLSNPNYYSPPTVFNNVNKVTCILHVPFGSKSAYQSAYTWGDFKNIVDDLPGLNFSKPTLNISNIDGSTDTLIINSNINWTVSIDQSWLTVNKTSGTNNDTLVVVATENTGNTRTAILTVNSPNLESQIITINQASKIQITVPTTTVSIANTTTASAVSIASNTTWDATTDVNWLTLTPANGNGDGTISITPSANPTTSARTATITIASPDGTMKTVTVSQAGADPIITLQKTTISFTDSISTDSVIITSNGPWSANSDVSWLSVSPASGTGNDTIIITAEPNTSGIARTGSVTISSDATVVLKTNTTQTISVTQAAKTGTAFNEISENDFSMYPNPTSKSFTIKIEGKATVEVYTSNSELLIKTQITGMELIPISNLPVGIYIVKVITDKKVSTKTLIVE